MLTTLFLTVSERRRFDALPEKLKADWTVNDETGTAYETDDELTIRAHMAEVAAFPALKTMIADMRAGKKVDISTLGAIPDDLIPELLFSIGARGISLLIDEMLRNVTMDEEVQAIAGFSHFRRNILESNAKILSR